jgi:transposase
VGWSDPAWALPGEEEFVLHVGLDLSRKRVDVCLISSGGELLGQFPAPADRDGLHGLARRVAAYGEPVRGRDRVQSGRAMIEALIAGERDGAKLAELAMGKMRPKVPALTEALTGHFGPHHAVACHRILGHLDFLGESIAALTEQIDQRTAAFAPVYTSLLPVPGFDRLSIDVIIAETGADMSRIPTAGDLASWVGVCPGSHESAGKRRTSAPPAATGGSDAH